MTCAKCHNIFHIMVITDSLHWVCTFDFANQYVYRGHLLRNQLVLVVSHEGLLHGWPSLKAFGPEGLVKNAEGTCVRQTKLKMYGVVVF